MKTNNEGFFGNGANSKKDDDAQRGDQQGRIYGHFGRHDNDVVNGSFQRTRNIGPYCTGR